MRLLLVGLIGLATTTCKLRSSSDPGHKSQVLGEEGKPSSVDVDNVILPPFEFEPNANAFNVKNAIWLSAASYYVYGSEAQVRSVFQKWGFADDKIFFFNVTESSHEIYRFIHSDTQFVWAEKGDMILVAFRGTEPDKAKDIAADATFWRSKYGNNGYLHSGFYGAVTSIWRDLLTCLKRADGRKPIWLTGHSLGAALATIAAGELMDRAASGNEPYVKGLMTFGSPRVGDKTYAKFFTDRMKANNVSVIRFRNQNDLVTLVPGVSFRGMTLEHVGYPVYFSESGAWSAGDSEIKKLQWPESIAGGIFGRGLGASSAWASTSAAQHAVRVYLDELKVRFYRRR